MAVTEGLVGQDDSGGPDKPDAPGRQGHRWRQGWWSGARRRTSPNHGLRPPGAVPELVVVHSISLPPGQFGGGEIERFFKNRLDHDAHPYFGPLRGVTVSAHFLVLRDGGLRQFVSCDHRAWHAGVSQWRGRANCNDWSIGIELEGLAGQPFAPVQYPVLAGLLAAVAQRYPVVELVGHEHVAPGRKQDPGPGFDWQALAACPGFPAAWAWPA